MALTALMAELHLVEVLCNISTVPSGEELQTIGRCHIKDTARTSSIFGHITNTESLRIGSADILLSLRCDILHGAWIFLILNPIINLYKSIFYTSRFPHKNRIRIGYYRACEEQVV